MASTYLSLQVHVIFATDGRAPSIGEEWRSELHSYIGGVVRGLGAVPIMIGGTADHVHALVGLRATHAVADVVREVKKASSLWAADRFARFRWQTGYGAFSVSPGDVERTIAYIADQEQHHRKISSAEELKALMAEFGVEWDERFFE